MKSMTKLMIVAMVLVAALVVAPAAARDVSDGGTIYVGEDNLNLEAVFDDAATSSSGTLVYYSNIASSSAATVGRTISVANVSEFDLTATGVGSSFGTWYAFTGASFIDPSAANGSVLVEDPSANLRVLLGDSGTTSVDGQSVTRANDIRFRIDHNLAGLEDAADPDYNVMQVRVTLPGGGTVNTLDGQLLNVALTGQWNETDPISLTGLGLGTYTARAVWPTGSADLEDSNAVTFEIVSGTVAITSNKDTVVRGNSFTVTITGESETDYWLNVTTAGDDLPTIKPNQIGVTVDANDTSSAVVETTAGGTRSVEFSTTTETEARTYTIEVEGPIENGAPATNSKTDSVRVRVEEGAVTVTASGTGVYYIGEEITLSGTCTDNNTVYLFMTGPNLNGNGVSLDENLPAVVSGTESSFTRGGIEVEADDTWSFDWNTANLGRSLDAGGYTIYAAAEPQGRNDLSGVKYDSVSVQLRSGFITATTSGATVAKGDDLTISGTAQGNPDDGVRIWIFGKNYYGAENELNVITANVESDGSFEEDNIDTSNLASGQYFVVVQHPMASGFGVVPGSDADSNSIFRLGADGNPTVFVANLVGLQASEAANALITALDSPYVDDTYVKLTFVIEEAQIFIDPIGDKAAGSTFTITGTTNLAVGDTLNVEVTSAAFQPTSKTEAAGFASVAGTAEVQQGDGANTWSFEVDGTSFKPDQYIVRVESIDTDTTATANFNVVEAVPTTQPTTPVETETAVTTAPTTTTEATPTQSPGFGALLALAGLGAVAFLVLRRD
ncbi:MAG: hypothetical protein PWR16_1473 [Methanoculleus sp.]|nr:hypothetical protein [Methanoculleus sp.]